MRILLKKTKHRPPQTMGGTQLERNVLASYNFKYYSEYCFSLALENLQDKAGICIAILGRGPWAFQIGKIRVANPFVKDVICQLYVTRAKIWYQ